MRAPGRPSLPFHCLDENKWELDDAGRVCAHSRRCGEFENWAKMTSFWVSESRI